jgi:ABC-2 type transport system permease protein
MQTTMLTILPAMLISGFMFPRESMPQVIRFLSYGLPLTYFLQVLRGIILKGVGLEYLYGQAVALAIFAVVIAGMSIVRFHRTLE